MGKLERATATWKGEHAFHVELPGGETITLASVPADDRPGPGPSPMEAVQAAVAACTGIDVVMILSKMRKKLRALRIEVAATRRDAQPRIYTHIELTYHVDGEEIDAAAVRRAIDLSQNKYCSVSAMLRPPVEMSYKIVLNGESI